MNKAEWDALATKEKDGMVGASVFKKRAIPVMELEGTKHETVAWYWGEGETMEGVLPEFTTDRNACALVLDAIEERDREFVLAKALHDELDLRMSGWNNIAISIRRILSADPDMICYCALKAVEDAR